MRIVVLGATGQTGLQVVDQALVAGHQVTAYVRRRGELPSNSNLSLVIGQLDDVAAMTAAFEGADAVICCLGPGGPADLLGRQHLMTRAVSTVTACMKSAGVQRFVLLSALGVGESRRKTSARARFAYSTIVRAVYADKLASEKALAATDLDWTVVYPAVLTNSPTSKPARAVPLQDIASIPGFPKVSRADVARTILEAVGGRWSRTTVVVTT